VLALLYCCMVDGSIPAIKLATYRRRLNLGLEVGNCHRAMFNFFYSCVRSWFIFIFFFFKFLLVLELKRVSLCCRLPKMKQIHKKLAHFGETWDQSSHA